jgi:hypothetical protein
MAKSATDAVLDGTLDVIATGTLLTVCNAEPTTYTEAATTYKLADVVLDSGDFSKANGDTNGRKVTIATQVDIPIDSSGTATHVAISTTSGSLLRVVTTCTSQALTAGGTVTTPAFDYEISDPA